MASQDTLKYAQSEEEKAKSLQREIEKEQMRIKALQGNPDTQDDIAAKEQIIASYQEKQRQHMEQAQRLRQKAEQEEQEELREQKQRKDGDSLMKKGVKEAIRRGLF